LNLRAGGGGGGGGGGQLAPGGLGAGASCARARVPIGGRVALLELRGRSRLSWRKSRELSVLLADKLASHLRYLIKLAHQSAARAGAS